MKSISQGDPAQTRYDPDGNLIQQDQMNQV